MVKQYPDTANFQGVPGNSTKGQNGIFQVEQNQPDFLVKGRYITSPAIRQEQIADGEHDKVNGKFIMAVDCPNVVKGQIVTITDKTGSLIIKSKVLFFKRSQLKAYILI